jgi:hypothetical protein
VSVAAAAECEQAEAEGEHHRALGHDDVDHYRADEEALLALEERAARGAVVAHLKGRLERRSTRRTRDSEAAAPRQRL